MARKHTLNAKEDAEFRVFYKTGASTAAIAERFDMSTVVVRRLLRERGLDLPKPSTARNYARPSISQQLQVDQAALARRTLKQEEERWRYHPPIDSAPKD
jgi:transposase